MVTMAIDVYLNICNVFIIMTHKWVGPANVKINEKTNEMSL